MFRNSVFVNSPIMSYELRLCLFTQTFANDKNRGEENV